MFGTMAVVMAAAAAVGRMHMVGMAMIVGGVLVIQLLSKVTGH